MKPTIYTLVGLQGSGKSTYATKLQSETSAVILNADTIRAEHPDWDNEKVFNKLYRQLKELAVAEKDVILDNTNTTIKSRAPIFKTLKGIDCRKIAIIIATPYQRCVERLSERNQLSGRQVPFEALRRYYEGFQIPFKEEGWDEIRVVQDENYTIKDWGDLLEEMDGFDQKSKHHKFNLRLHNIKTFEVLDDFIAQMKINNASPLLEATFWHDTGKLFTQSFKEGDPNAHYHNHANVGAYYLLENNFFNFFSKTEDMLECLFYVNYHMFPFNWDTEKAQDKWRGFFSEEKFKNLLLFNIADRLASGTENE